MVLNTIAAAMGLGRRACLSSAAGVAFGGCLWCLALILGAAAVSALLPWTERPLTLLAVLLFAHLA